MVNWSKFVGSFGVVAGVVVLAGTAPGLLGGHGPSVADEVAAVPAVSAPPAASASAYLCSVSCAPVQARELSAGEHRARAAYWASQKVTVPRSSGSGGSVSVATPKAPKQAAAPKQAKASQPKAAKSPSPKQQAAPKAPKQAAPSTTVTVTQKTTTTSKGTTTTSTTTKTTSKG